MTNENDDEQVSKTQLKREMEARQKVGEKLISYNEKQLSQFDFPDDLTAAIHEAKRIKSRLALSRHVQYIGRLMRRLDFSSIEKVISRIEQTGPSYLLERKRAETWRTRLLEDGSAAVTAFINEFDIVDIQQLRQLIREANKEKQAEKPGKHSKKLFGLIYSQIIK